MTICHVYYRYPLFSKTGSYFSEFLEGLLRYDSKLHIHLLSCKYPKNASVKEIRRLHYHWIPWPNFSVSIFNSLWFELALLWHGFTTNIIKHSDLIHVSNARGLVSAWILSTVFHKPLVVTVELFNSPGKGFREGVFFHIQRTLFRIFSKGNLIFWSHYHANIFGLDTGGSLHIIPPGIKISIKIDPKLRQTLIQNYKSTSVPLIVFAKPLLPGNFGSALLLLRAIARIKQQYRVNILFGNGPLIDEFLAQVDALDLKEVVHIMPPQVPFEQIPTYLDIADLIVLSFDYAPTIARSLLEAMLAGKPIVATNLGEIPYVLENNLSGVVVDPIPEALSEGILRVLSHPERAESLGVMAREVVRKDYSLENSSKRLLEFYHSLVS